MKWLPAVIRLALIGLLSVALWNPALPWHSRPINVIVLLDDSMSMSHVKSDQSMLQRIKDILQALPGNDKCTLMRFASGTAIEIPPSEISSNLIKTLLTRDSVQRRQPLDSTSTNIENAVSRALHIDAPGYQNVILLASDMKGTWGDTKRALLLARSADVPVYWLVPETNKAAMDGWITAMHMPERALQETPLTLGITLMANHAATGHLLLSVDGENYAEEPVALPQDKEINVAYQLQFHEPGIHFVKAHLDLPGDSVTADDEATVPVSVAGPLPVVYVSHSTGPTPLFQSLKQTGHDVQMVSPDRFLTNPLALLQTSSVILDDIAINDMSPSAWDALVGGVEHYGLGLIVLGGGHSFGAGNYRHSALEKILPVTAQGRESRQLAVLFLVDKSGSMEGSTVDLNRLDMAHRAVIQTARLLDHDTTVGMIAFDTKPSIALTLKPYKEPAQALSDAWQLSPSGGTRLIPALKLGLRQLSETPARRRLMVLVTDGFVEQSDFTTIERQIASRNVDIIALAIGKNVGLSELRRITDINHGKLLRVTNVAELPRIMTRSAEEKLAPEILGKIQIRQHAPLPFAASISPPPQLSGYMVTKPRNTATTYFETNRGDPLLASHFAGAGRVTVLPAGLGDWAASWPGWPGWKIFTAGLIDWSAANDADPLLHASARASNGNLEVTADTVSLSGHWMDNLPARAILTDPVQHSTNLPLIQTAPGRYSLSTSLTQAGPYLVTVRIGNHALRLPVVNDSTDEFMTGEAADRASRSMINDGLLLPLKGNTQIHAASHGEIPLRPWALAAVILCYTFLLIYERLGALPHFLRGLPRA